MSFRSSSSVLGKFPRETRPPFRVSCGFSAGMKASNARLQLCLLPLRVAQGRAAISEMISLSDTPTPADASTHFRPLT
jgi:hypothetical protein